jgi:hypothetical protein
MVLNSGEDCFWFIWGMFSVTTKLNFIVFVPFQVRNEKARRYLSSMRKKDPVPFSQKFPNADPLGLKLLEKLLAFDPKDRLTAEEVFFWCHFIILMSRFFSVALCL